MLRSSAKLWVRWQRLDKRFLGEIEKLKVARLLANVIAFEIMSLHLDDLHDVVPVLFPHAVAELISAELGESRSGHRQRHFMSRPTMTSRARLLTESA